MNGEKGLPPGWCMCDLEQVAEIRDELREPVNAKERATRQGPYPYFGATGQVGWIDGFRQDGEYVLLGEDGAPFFDPTKPKAYLVSGRCWVNNHAHVLKGIEGRCDNRFLMHALNAANYHGFANGTTRLKLTQGAMRKLPIPAPPLNEQRRIVAKIEELFSDLDAGVAALERARTNLKRYRAAVLKAAVEGRLTARWRAEHPDVEPAPALLQRLLAERRRRWEADQLAAFEAKGKQPPQNWRNKYQPPAEPDTANLPALPPGWCWATVDQLMVEDCINGTSPRGSDNPPGVRALRLSAMGDRGFDYSEYRFIQIDKRTTESLTIREGDFFVARGNGSLHLVGRGTLAQAPPDEIVFPDTMIRFRVGLGIAPYLNVIWRSRFVREQVESTARTSAGIYKISQGDIRGFRVPIPPSEEQCEIVACVSAILSAVDEAETALDRSLRRASRLRQSILKRAFEGRLVPQDPADEPAAALLARRVAERRTSAADGGRMDGASSGSRPRPRRRPST